MKKSVKLIVLGFAVLVVAAGGVYTMTAPVVLPLTAVNAKAAELAFTEQGIVSAGNTISIFPLTQGKLLRVVVREGQAVREGDVLCEIDPSPLRLRAEELQAVIKGYEAQRRAAEAQDRSSGAIAADRRGLQDSLIEQNRRDVDRAREDLGKRERLYAEGGISLAEVDAARALVERCESALTVSLHELAVINAGSDSSGMADYYNALIDSSKAALGQVEREIDSCSVRATADGVVTSLPAKGANIVSAAAPVAEITVGEEAVIEAYISTQDLGYVREGGQVDLLFKRREGDILFHGQVIRVDTVAQTKLSALGGEERKVKVQIAPDRASAGSVPLGTGFSVDVKFIIYKEENQLAVPKAALYKDGGRDMLWLVRDGKAQAEEVTLGMELRTETVIKAGLAPGDFVVADANNPSLRNGLKVKGE